MRLTERYHRRDFGHMDVQVTVDEPQTYTKPFTYKFTDKLLPDTDLIESFCSENEKDTCIWRPSAVRPMTSSRANRSHG